MRLAMFALALLATALLATACGAPASQTSAPAPAPVVAPAYRSADPAADRFAEAYRRVFCKANYGYDPEGSMEALKEPLNTLKQLQKMGSDRLASYLEILASCGFASLGEFDQKAAELRQDKEFWSGLEAGLLNDLTRCNQ